MYFGYAQMYLLPFVPVGFAFVIAMGIALALIYLVGASKGGAAAGRYLAFCTRLLLGGLAAILAWAVISGQWGQFMERYGWLPLIEMSLLAFMMLASAMMLATSYVHSKKD